MTLTDTAQAGPTVAPAVSLDRISFSYNGRQVLQNVTLAIPDGEFMAIIGPNGGGKSTLVKIILGLLKPDSGHVSVLGLPPEKAARLIGYMPQDVLINRSFPISVMDVVLMGRLRNKGRSRITPHDRNLALDILDRLAIGDLAGRKIADISGGQRAKVFLARALVTDPKILILDEPTSSLDTNAQTELYALLKQINAEKTVILVSHDLMVLSTHVRAVACVNREVHFHAGSEITPEMFNMAFPCPVELIAHGIPHRILKKHTDDNHAH
ncbi:MAG: ABC transporter ATP-binding protein [Deltaproteobacteria bacterium]|nr:ABC transporter ATP-binding protein [Deltaproteobacteria bacterium]